MEVARYISYCTGERIYVICTEPAQDTRYPSRVWMRIAPDGGEFDIARTRYEDRDQALIVAGMRIEAMERERHTCQ